MYPSFCIVIGLLLIVDLAGATNPPGIPIINENFDSTPTVGINMVTSCNSTAVALTDPPTNITWLRDGTFITGATQSTIGLVTTSYVSIPIPSRSMNNAIITCQAANTVGQRSTSRTIVEVRQSPNIPTIIPVGGLPYFDEGTIGNWTLNVTRAYPSVTTSGSKCYVNGNEIAVSRSITTNTDDNTYNLLLTMSRALTAADHNVPINCEITHITFPGPDNKVTRSYTMIVRHVPGQPIISTSFGTSGVNEGTIIHGNCSSRGGYPTPTVRWTGPSGMSLSSTTQGDLVFSRFDITAVVALIGQTFTCTASNAMTSFTATTTLSQVYVAPGPVTIEGFNRQIIEGQTMNLSCTSRGALPRAIVTWTLPNGTVDRSFSSQENRTTTATFNTLEYTAHFTDNGKIFTCNASNQRGLQYLNTDPITVYVPPSSNPTVTGVNIVWESHTYFFICSTNATNPAATISWTFGGVNITSQARSTQESNLQKPGTFNTFSNLTLPVQKSDVGKVLTCSVHHMTQPGTSLSTNHPLAVYLIPTAYVAEQTPVAQIGTFHALTCNVDTVLTATVTWYKSGSTGAVALQNNALNYVIGERTLSFSPIILEHEGQYMCSASNDAGDSGISPPVYLTVYELPGVPIIAIPSTAVEGQRTYINASSYGGYPAPALSWERNGVVVDNTSTTDGSITYNDYSFIASLADIKVPFRANASNGFGVFSTSNALADVFAPASPPAIDGADVAYEGTPVTHQCSSARARPAPALYWRLGNTDMTSQATQATFNNSDLVTVRTTSNLTFTPAPGDEGKQLICILYQPNAHDTNLSIILNLNIYLKPRVSLESTATDVMIGTTKILRCETVSVLPVIVLWFVDNLELSPSVNYVMSGQYLTIVDFGTSDNGAYSCKSQNGAGSSNQTSQLVLTAYAPPGSLTLTKTPTSTPNENEAVSLTCSTSNGVPSPNITWTKNGTTLYNSIVTTVTETLVSSTLTFVANYVNDKGSVFRCTTMNEFGTQSAFLTISNVNVLPTQGGTTILGISTLYEGQTSQFYCENSRTLPVATITWILGQEILVGQPSYTENLDGTWKVSSNLTHQARYADSGNMNLVCRVTHTTGYSVNTTLQMYGYSKPRVSISRSSVIVVKGSSLLLHCVVVSELGSVVTWYKSNTGMTLTSSVLYTFNGPNVTINSVAVSDEGGYYCMARNTAGNSTNSNVIDVTVYADPVKPVITGLEKAVKENTLLTINCTSADGYPLPVIRWYRNGSLIWTAPAGLHSSYSFQVAFSDRDTWYTCTATNSYNNATSDPTKIPDVYLLPSGVSLTGPAVVYQTKRSVFLCSVTRVSPRHPTFRWLVGPDTVTSSSNVTATSGGNFAISSYFSYVFQVSDVGKIISCIVTQEETNTTVTRSQSLILHLLPTVQNIASSENVELYTNPTVSCDVSSTDSNFSVTWYKNGVAIDTAGSGGKYSTTKTVLTITSFQVSDTGLYTCRASHQGGSSGMSLPANLTGFEYPFKPTITSNHPSRIVIEGNTLMLNCSTTGGVPLPAVVWKRGTSETIVDAISTTFAGSNTLVFNEYSSVVTFSDNSSVYVCEAKNPHLKVSSTFTLLDVYVTPIPTVMHSPVSWDESSAIASYYEDQTYVINGSIPRYNPRTAVIYWLINNQIQAPIQTTESLTDQMIFAYTSAIELVMSKDLDGKKVVFMVQHPETTSRNVSFTIKILYKPRVSFSNASAPVRQGENFAIKCNVTSSLGYNVTWKIKGNDTRIANSGKYLITGAVGGTLTILNVNFTDMATYVCSAMNSAGAAVEAAEFYMIVYREVGMPVMTGFDQFVVHGTTVSVYCNSSGGDPQATIAWQKNGAPLSAPTPTYGNDNTNPVYSVVTFVVDFYTDQNAVFKCTASNSFSSHSDEKSFQDVHIFSSIMSLSGREPTTVTAGTPYTFYSQTSGMYPIPQVVWLINNVRQFNGYVTENAYESGTYRINSSFTFTPSRNDNGHQVVCKFDHTLQTGRSINASRTLNVQFPTEEPSIEGFSSSVTENVPQSLVCTVNGGNPRPIIRWLKNNTIISGTTNTETTDDDGNYVTSNRYNFTPTQADSFAVFTCHSQHVVQNYSQTVNMGHIKALPSNIILTLPSEPLTDNQPKISNSPNLLVGKSYEFKAEVGRVWPVPTIDWRVGNSYPANHTSNSNDNDDGTVRTMSSLYYAPTLADNGQDLTLQVFHPQTSATPVIQTAPLVVHGPPKVSIKPDSTDVVVNVTFFGRCNVTSSLNVYVTTWYKGDEEISNGAKYTINGDFLTIASVQFADQGDYSCTATSVAGTSLRSNAVTVSVISEGGAAAISGFENTPRENDILTLRCSSAGGVPTPSVIWSKNGVNLNIGDSSVTENGVTTTTSVWTYQVQYADRNANFTCLVSNSVANRTRTKVFTDVYIPPVTVTNPVSGPTTTVAGTVTTFSINFPRVNPAPIVSWSIGGVSLPSNVPPITSVPTSEGALSATASITFTQLAEYNGKALIASVNQPQSGTVLDVSATLTVKSQPLQPVIDGFPSTRIGVVDDIHQLVCTVSGGYPVPTVGWYRNNEQILTSPTTDFSVDPIITTATYNMAVTLSEKNVVYRCTAVNEINALNTEVSLTEVYVKAYVTISGSSDVISGKNTSMSCTTTAGRPVPTLAWSMVDLSDVSTSLSVKEESVGQPDNNGLVIVTSTVYFVPTVADNRKTIRCALTQPGLTHSHDASNTITVHGPPSAEATPNVNATIGSTANFVCTVSSSRPYNVTWYKRVSDTEGTVIPIQINEKYAVDSNPHRLWIYNIDVNDNGRYYCIAQSDAGTSSRSEQTEVSLTVYTAPSTPSFENDVTERTVNENDGSITAKCLTNVSPANTASYEWDFIPAGSTVRTLVDSAYINNNELTIPSASRTHAGTYVCRAFNSYGSAERNFTVDVQYRPELAPNVKTSHPTATVGERIELSCNVIANPPATSYIWTHQSEEVWTSETYDVTVKSGENTYTCVATNAVGSSQGLIFTIVAPQADGAPSTGASTADEGLSGGVIAAIVLGVIFILLILIICCVGCKYYKDKKTEEKAKRTVKKTKAKHKPSSVAPDVDDRRSTLYPRAKDSAALMFGPSRPQYPDQRHFPRDIAYIERDFSQRGVYETPNTYYIPAPGSELDDMSMYRETGFRSRRRKLPNVLPPLATGYTAEAKRRKDRRKKNRKRKQQERQSGEGMENPGKSKDNSPQINIDDNQPEKGAAEDTNILLGDRFKI